MIFFFFFFFFFYLLKLFNNCLFHFFYLFIYVKFIYMLVKIYLKNKKNIKINYIY